MDKNSKEAILVTDEIQKNESILEEFKKLKPKNDHLFMSLFVGAVCLLNYYLTIEYERSDILWFFNTLIIIIFSQISASNRIIHKRLDLLEKLIKRSSS